MFVNLDGTLFECKNKFLGIGEHEMSCNILFKCEINEKKIAHSIYVTSLCALQLAC